jgi:MFS family permease
MSIFGRTRPDDRTRTDGDTPAEAAEREAYEAERVEARERAPVVREKPVHPIAVARDRFGGIDFPASLVGMLTALAMLVLLGGLVGAAVDAIGYQTGLDRENVEDISVGSFIGGLVVLFVAYLVGGWAAGRIARYDGVRNGLMTGIWTIILAAILAGLGVWLGDEYDVFANVDLPQWFNEDAVTTAAVVSGAIAIVTMLFGGLLGGLWGTRYHRRADETLLDARELRDVDVR